MDETGSGSATMSAGYKCDCFSLMIGNRVNEEEDLWDLLYSSYDPSERNIVLVTIPGTYFAPWGKSIYLYTGIVKGTVALDLLTFLNY